MAPTQPRTAPVALQPRRDAIADLCDRASHRFVVAARDHGGMSADASDALKEALRNSLAEAFEEGRRHGIAEELGVRSIAFRDAADRFPWQVFCADETCVLVTHDLRNHVVIASELREEDGPFLLRSGTAPEALLCLVRRVLLR